MPTIDDEPEKPSDPNEHVYCERCGDCLRCDPECYCVTRARQQAEDEREAKAQGDAT